MRSTTLASSFAGFAGLTSLPLRFSDERAQGVLVAVGELAGIEVAGLLLDDLLGDLQHLRIGLRQLGQRHLVEGANLLYRPQGGEDQPAPPRSRWRKCARAVLITIRPMATMFCLAIAARITAIGLDAGLAGRHEMVGRVPVEPVDAGARHELLDIDVAGRFELHRVELLLVEQDILALGDLEALHCRPLAARDLLVGAGVDGLHADAVVGLGVDQVEADGFRFRRRRPQGDRTGHE